MAEQGYELLWSGKAGSLPAAAQSFRAALRDNPASPYRWCDLGEALAQASRWQEAGKCFDRAAELGPNVPPVLMRAANFYFRAGDTAKALHSMSRVLELTGAYDRVVFNSYLHLAGNVDDVLAGGIPLDRRPAAAFLRYVIENGTLEDAGRVWSWARSHSFVDDALAAEYTDFLLRSREYDRALEEWSRYLGKRAGQYSGENALFNGGFEQNPTGAKLDWIIHPEADVTVTRDPSAAYSGRFALRLEFRGQENVSYRHTELLAVVKPGPYRFSAWMRSEGITTDRGVGMRVFAPESTGRLDVWTDTFTGTSPWTEIQRNLAVPAGVRLVAVQVVRQASGKFDNKIAGTVWIDDVRLVPVHGARR